MTTIDNIEDFLRIVREDEGLRSAVRRELLTEELLDLPARVASMSKTQDSILETQNSILKEIADLRQTQNEMLKTQDSILKEIADLRQTQNAILERLGNVEGDTKQNIVQIGEMKGLFMERSARDDAPIITSDMGLRWLKTLGRGEVVMMADEAQRSGLAAGISRHNMRTFRRADLVIEAATSDGETHYVAVEISYTADNRDTERATRHAEYITRFTGIPAYAAIASVHTDNRIEGTLTEDAPQPLDVDHETKVFWSRLPELESPN
jgi:recombinational DNA repair ATPase RecF